MALGFSACSSDDDLAGAESQIEDQGNLAYMSVTIQGATEADTRALEASDFSKGNENTVKDIKFYYFNSKGEFMAKGSLWKSEDWQDGTSEVNNIEKYRVSIVSVPNYDANKKPTMMVTVVNPPESLSMSIGDNISKLFNGLIDYQTSIDNTNYYIMTTSSYIDTNRDESPAYYVTDLTDATFYQTVTQANATDAKRVDVYVERLAAKVTTTLKNDAATYRLGEFDLDDDPSTPEETLYITFRGWMINGTAKTGYYMKHLNPSWTNKEESLNFDWNSADLHRSFWAMSKDYHEGEYTYPDRYKQGDVTEEGKYNTSFDLNYYSGNEVIEHTFGESNPQYCNENTQSAITLSESASGYKPHLPGALSHVLLLAQFTDENGQQSNTTEEKTIIKFGDKYLYKPVVLNEFFIGAAMGSYEYSDDGTTWTALKSTDLVIASSDDLNGYVLVKVNANLKDKKFHKVAAEGNTDVTYDDLNTELESFRGTSTLNLYNNGFMYYYSLIRHLNPEASNGRYTTVEGHYGVVRNHYYKVNILGFSKSGENKEDGKDEDVVGPEGPADGEDPIDPGKGIENQDEPIIPNDEEDKNYYIGANINILSWRLVSQNVKL
jgi:hypothetical protein